MHAVFRVAQLTLFLSARPTGKSSLPVHHPFSSIFLFVHVAALLILVLNLDFDESSRADSWNQGGPKQKETCTRTQNRERESNLDACHNLSSNIMAAEPAAAKWRRHFWFCLPIHTTDLMLLLLLLRYGALVY